MKHLVEEGNNMDRVEQATAFYNAVLTDSREFSTVPASDYEGMHEFLSDVNRRDGVFWLLSQTNREESNKFFAKWSDYMYRAALLNEEGDIADEKLGDLLTNHIAFGLIHLGNMEDELDMTDPLVINMYDEEELYVRSFVDDAYKYGSTMSLLTLLARALRMGAPTRLFYDSVRALPTIEEAVGE